MGTSDTLGTSDTVRHLIYIVKCWLNVFRDSYMGKQPISVYGMA